MAVCYQLLGAVSQPQAVRRVCTHPALYIASIVREGAFLGWIPHWVVSVLSAQVYEDGQLVEDLYKDALSVYNLGQYDGFPCPARDNPCQNGGECLPLLNDYECKCPAMYTGKKCDICKYRFSSGYVAYCWHFVAKSLILLHQYWPSSVLNVPKYQHLFQWSCACAGWFWWLHVKPVICKLDIHVWPYYYG